MNTLQSFPCNFTLDVFERPNIALQTLWILNIFYYAHRFNLQRNPELDRLVMSVKQRLDAHCSQEESVNCLLIKVTEGQERKCWKQCVRVNANALSPSLETFGSSLALIFTKGKRGSV